MKNKSFAVIGLGQFGMTLAVTLAESDCDVLAIDDKEENIEEISEKVTYAVKADVREPGILKALGVQNVDVAIIGCRKSGSQYFRDHAGQGSGSALCSCKKYEFSSWTYT